MDGCKRDRVNLALWGPLKSTRRKNESEREKSNLNKQEVKYLYLETPGVEVEGTPLMFGR